jgi:hypothetical protein
VLHEHVAAQPSEVLRGYGDWGIPQLFAGAFDPKILAQIPSLNAGAHHAEHQKLVRFRCMVQDSFEPEYFIGSYDEIDKTGARTVRCGRYQDDIVLPLGSRAELHTTHSERSLYHCIAIPGEANWLGSRIESDLKTHAPAPADSAADADAAAGVLSAPAATRAARKRTVDDISSSAAPSGSRGPSVPVAMTASPARIPALPRPTVAASSDVSTGASAAALASTCAPALSLAVPTPSCVAKFYGTRTGLRIGDVIEIVAVASVCNDDVFVGVSESKPCAAADCRRRARRARGGAGAAMCDEDDDEASSASAGPAAAAAAAAGDDDDDDDDDEELVVGEPGSAGCRGHCSCDDDGSGATGARADDDDFFGPSAASREPLRLHVLLHRRVAPTAGVVPDPYEHTTPVRSGNVDEEEEDGAAAAGVAAAAAAPASEPGADGTVSPVFEAVHARLRAPLSTAGAMPASASAAEAATEQATGFEAMRAAFLSLATPVFAGDVVAAQALLLQLLARVHARRHGRAVGRLNFALSHLSRAGAAAGPAAAAAAASATAARVCALVSALAPRSVARAVTIESLNERRWGPVRDAVTARLAVAPLQISGGTVVVLDETQLGEGALAHTGVRNLQMIGRLVNEAAVEYEIPYAGPLAFPVDAAVLVTAANKPLLPHDLRVPLKPAPAAAAAAAAAAGQSGHDDRELPQWFRTATAAEAAAAKAAATTRGGVSSAAAAAAAAAATAAGADRRWQLREYLQLARHTPTQFDEAAAARAEEALFARMQADSGARNEEHMHAQMTLSRLFAMSYGEAAVSQQRWEQAREFLDEVMQRNAEL